MFDDQGRKVCIRYQVGNCLPIGEYLLEDCPAQADNARASLSF
jgi:hypothetical protein